MLRVKFISLLCYTVFLLLIVNRNQIKTNEWSTLLYIFSLFKYFNSISLKNWVQIHYYEWIVSVLLKCNNCCVRPWYRLSAVVSQLSNYKKHYYNDISGRRVRTLIPTWTNTQISTLSQHEITSSSLTWRMLCSCSRQCRHSEDVQPQCLLDWRELKPSIEFVFR